MIESRLLCGLAVACAVTALATGFVLTASICAFWAGVFFEQGWRK